MKATSVLSVNCHEKQLQWDYKADLAYLQDLRSLKTIWKGSLLPAFELNVEGKSNIYVKADVSDAAFETGTETETAFTLMLDFPGFGSGQLHGLLTSWGLRFTELTTIWSKATAVVMLFWGTRLLSEQERRRTQQTNKAFWPDWSSRGYCVPCAGSSPTKSFWRSWDMGNAHLPLGSFGDSMGTPYAAAFPRPIYAAAMGDQNGWIAFGPGCVPDSALSLKLQSVTACLEYRHREDLWGAVDPTYRVWPEPLRLAWGDSGFEALDQLYRSFEKSNVSHPKHLRSFLCTWGDFKEGKFDLKQYTRRVSCTTPADMIVLDDNWETFNGSTVPNETLFPDFDSDLQLMRDNGYDIAFWQAVGWVDQPEVLGLTKDDLLCGADGEPRQWIWSGNPLSDRGYHYCLDPSSERTRQYLRERTENLVRRYNPCALKLDFGYGFPGPDVCSPRNSAFRGEMLAFELIRIIGDAAKAINIDITIIYYSIHPLFSEICDMVNLDDLGDAGDSAAYERSGHNQRCLWAALAANSGIAINTSTGYFWDTLDSILLDTAVIGVNGLTLGETDTNGNTMNDHLLNRWLALQHWRRRSCSWRPLWLEADLGGLGNEPSIISWGRLEQSDLGNTILTSLALRNLTPDSKQYAEADFVRFTGNWALIAQDDRDISVSRLLACIPFQTGTITLTRNFTCIHLYQAVEGRIIRTKTITKAKLPDLKITITETELSLITGFLIESA